MSAYDQESINQVGRILVSDDATPEERANAWHTLNSWRALHLYPLRRFQAVLRGYARNVAGKHKSIVSQRLKPAPTILATLRRDQAMELGQMPDIGGVRAVVPNVKMVGGLAAKYRQSHYVHALVKDNDYIAEPKESGYRGIHLIYQYSSLMQPECDGLLVEIQLRSRLQHLWAAAVETVELFHQKSLKSSQGSETWLEFFRLVSALFAWKEGTAPPAAFQGIAQEELIHRLRTLNQERKILSSLKRIRITERAKYTQTLTNAAFWIIETSLNRPAMTRIHPFVAIQKEDADLVYRQLEQSPDCRAGKSHVVFVSVNVVRKLEKAYPNFFGDITEFIKELEKILGILALR
ncbi:MAG: RelA/SpoT domain-containing protein [Desulfobulbaceae bacterium]|jgi:hypothetical protein|nr:RelA/SpoT domain-containing protein [Desulfobulbaceae bacterium]